MNTVSRIYIVVKVFLIFFFPVLLSAQDKFAILFVANINGTLENCGCGQHPLGGVDRCKTVIEQCRQNYPDLLVINGGDYFNSYSFLALNSTLLKALPLLHFDLLVPGDQEFVEGKQFISKIRTIMGQSWFLSNTEQAAPKMKSLYFLKQQINVYAYLSPNCFSFIHQPKDLVLNSIRPDFPDDNPDSFNLIVYHGSREEAYELARTNPQIALILLGHDQYSYADSIGHTLLVGAGRDAEFVVLLRIGRSGSEWKIKQEHINLTETIPADKDISALITSFKSNINQETN